MLCSRASSPLCQDFAFIPANSSASRSPCPALNALANHGYIARDGTNIPFWTLLSAVKHVYNLSFPLALLLTSFGYLTSGTFSLFYSRTPQRNEPRILSLLMAFTNFIPWPSWTLDLSSLSAPGPLKIAHDGSLVHADETHSSAPDPTLLTQFLTLAYHAPSPLLPENFLLQSSKTCDTKSKDGLTLADLGRLHAARLAALPHALNRLHEQVALGECGLAWCVMRRRGAGDGDEDEDGVIPPEALEQWFGEERLPEGWWDVDGGRPARPVGIREAGRRAKEVGLLRHGV